MITKFEKYNEGRIFKKENDNDIKELFDEIKKNFDVSKLKKDSYNIYIYRPVRIYRSFGLFIPGSYDYVLYLYTPNGNGYSEIKDVSEYIVKDLYKFFDKAHKDKQKSDTKSYTKELISKTKKTESPTVATTAAFGGDILPEPKTKIERPKLGLSGLKKFID